MYRRVALAASYPELGDIAQQYDISVKSMTLWYSHLNPGFAEEFRYYTHDEVEKERDDRLDEIDASLALTLLASIEASFRVDYLRRCYRRRKDALSRYFRALYRKKGRHVSFEEELLDGWSRHGNVRQSLLGDIKDAFKYRHWLAHGRYWMPRLGRRYDFSNIFDLADTVVERIPFEKP